MEIKNYELEPNPRIVNTMNSQDDIYVTVKIGNGQIGGNKVSSDGEMLAKGNLTEPTYIGNLSTIADKKIEFETNVLDVNSFTNRCVITTSFFNQNNKELYSKIDKGDAPENGVASFKGRYVVNFILAIIFFFFINQQNVFAQATSEDIDFNKLETPSAPGLILFDQTTSSIEKPTTPQGLGISILSLGQNGGALECAPFWLTDHPSLTAKDMYTNKTPILSHLAVSIASAKTDTLSFISAGIRTRLFQSFGDNVEELNSYKSQLEELLVDPISNSEKIDSIRKAYVKNIQNPVLSIDLAAAFGGSSAINSFDSLNLNRWAVWLSFNWRPKGKDFYTTVLTRYINFEEFNDTNIVANLVDLGARLNYDISKVTLSLEYINRMNFTTNNLDDYRLAVIGSYQVSDNIFVTSTFGKNFSDVNNIIALAGLNFGFSKKKVKAY